ncbi:MAG: 30S ribosomal protein S18, partial [Myxococcota bacterium]
MSNEMHDQERDTTSTASRVDAPAEVAARPSEQRTGEQRAVPRGTVIREARADDEMHDDDRGDSPKGTVIREGRADTDPLGIRRRRANRKRPPSFAMDDEFLFDYKDPQRLRFFLTDRGKIVPRRITGLTASQQRKLTVAVKRARMIALLPFT